MKNLIVSTLCLVGFLSFGLESAEARIRPANGPVYISGYLNCGTPVYHQRVFAGYNRWGNARFVVQRVQPPARRVVRRGSCRPIRRPVCRPARRPVCRPVRGHFRRHWKHGRRIRDRRIRGRW